MSVLCRPNAYRMSSSIWHKDSNVLRETSVGVKYGTQKQQTTTFSVEEAVEQLGFGRFQIKLILLCGIFRITDSIQIAQLALWSRELRCEWRLEDWHMTFLNAGELVAMFAGSYTVGTLADRYGRRPILLLTSSWIACYGILLAFSPSYPWAVMFRGLLGAGCGGTMTSAALIIEYLPIKYRAKSMLIMPIFWSTGTVFEVFLAYIIIPRQGWRGFILVSAIPAVITFIISAIALPQSARYLLAAGHKEKAVEVLKYAATQNGTSLPPGHLVQSALVPRGQLVNLFTSGYRSTVLLVWVLFFGSGFVYYGAILGQPEILRMGGVCGAEIHQSRAFGCHCRPFSTDEYVSLITAALGELFVVPVNLLTVEFIGRRRTLGLGLMGVGLLFCLSQICTPHGRLLDVCLFGIRTLIHSVQCVMIMYTVEVLPTTIRSLGIGTGGAASRLGGLITLFVAQHLTTYSVRLSLGVYAALSIACAIAAFCLPVETTDRPLQQSHTE